MSEKSIKRRLQDAADLVAIVGVTLRETLSVSVSPYGTRFHLIPLALVRVFREANLPRGRLQIHYSAQGDLHIEFKFRGAEWACCVLCKDRGAWETSIANRPQLRIEQRQLLLTE